MVPIANLLMRLVPVPVPLEVAPLEAPLRLEEPSRGRGRLLHHPRKLGHVQVCQQLDGLAVHLDHVRLDRRLLGHEVHAPLALLLLQLQRDAAHGAALDALHQVRREPRNLVAQPLRRDDGHLLRNLLVGLEVQSHARVVPLDHHPRRLLHGLRPHTPLQMQTLRNPKPP
jgi:hypothetical protein